MEEAFCSNENRDAEQPFSVLLPNKPKRIVDAKCISVVKTILERCKKEQSLNRLQVPLDDHVLRVSFYTGLPCAYLSHLDTQEYNTPKKPTKVIDLIAVLKCLKEEYTYKRYPTMKQVFEAVLLFRVKNKMKVIDYDQFCQQMLSLRFRERPTKTKCYLLMEDPKITFERYNYLSSLRKYRNKDIHIYYLDERILGKSLTSDGYGFTNFMLFYAVLKNNGYVRGLYCTDPDKNDYMKWITDILLPLLIPSSLIIMSHGLFHETADSYITRYHSKAEMLKWLTTNNIPSSEKMHKAELYELISRYFLKYEPSNIECVLKAHGHEVLIRPASLIDCTPTESFWNDLESEVSLTTAKGYDPNLQDKIQTYISSCTQLQWFGYEELIVKQEKHLLTVDQQIEESLENYEFDTVECESLSLSVGDDYRIVSQ